MTTSKTYFTRLVRKEFVRKRFERRIRFLPGDKAITDLQAANVNGNRLRSKSKRNLLDKSNIPFNEESNTLHSINEILNQSVSGKKGTKSPKNYKNNICMRVFTFQSFGN